METSCSTVALYDSYSSLSELSEVNQPSSSVVSGVYVSHQVAEDDSPLQRNELVPTTDLPYLPQELMEQMVLETRSHKPEIALIQEIKERNDTVNGLFPFVGIRDVNSVSSLYMRSKLESMVPHWRDVLMAIPFNFDQKHHLLELHKHFAASNDNADGLTLTNILVYWDQTLNPTADDLITMLNSLPACLKCKAGKIISAVIHDGIKGIVDLDYNLTASHWAGYFKEFETTESWFQAKVKKQKQKSESKALDEQQLKELRRRLESVEQAVIKKLKLLIEETRQLCRVGCKLEQLVKRQDEQSKQIKTLAKKVDRYEKQMRKEKAQIQRMASEQKSLTACFEQKSIKDAAKIASLETALEQARKEIKDVNNKVQSLDLKVKKLG